MNASNFISKNVGLAYLIFVYIFGTLVWVAAHIPKFATQGVDVTMYTILLLILLIAFICLFVVLFARKVVGFYYPFIFASMALSVIMAPVMFIQQNALAGWLWIAVFLLFLVILFYEAIKKTATEGTKQYETSLGTIIAWVCIVGQWFFIYPNNSLGLYYNLGLMMALGSVFVGHWATVNEARRKHFGGQ